jgi:hypothetical protein
LIEVQETEVQRAGVQGLNDRAPENGVARALRENLGPLQRNALDLEQAFDEFVTACSSTKPGDALPAMLRAQAFAASLSASLSVLSNFAALALSSDGQSAVRTQQAPVVQPTNVAPVAPRDHEVVHEAVAGAPSVAVVEPTVAPFPEPAQEQVQERAQEQVPDHGPHDLADHLQTVDAKAMEVEPEPAPVEMQAQNSVTSVPSETIPVLEAAPHPTAFEPDVEVPESAQPGAAAPAEAAFDISTLPADIQDLHRRANRVAKVAMQDIKLLRPQDVQQGRENKDLCQRLRSDLDKARKEYDRRFRAIQDHPVDYFHRWAVDILAQGDDKALGEYPYPSPVLRH